MRKPPELVVLLAPAALVTAIVVVLGFLVAPGTGGPGGSRTALGVPTASAPGEASGSTRAGDRRTAENAGGKRGRATVEPVQLVAPRMVLVRKPRPRFRTVAPYSFTVASFNVLGHSHTVPGGNRPGWAPSSVRMGWAVASLHGHGIDVVGLQEFQAPQLHNFNGRAGGTYEVWPGLAVGHDGVENSLAWRRSMFRAVERHVIGVPYFGGRPKQMPYALLEHVATGQRLWVANFHNPATTKSHGNNVRWRRAATAVQIGLANRLATSGHPVFFTGDFNERAEYFCPLTMNTTLKAANGGSTGSPCQPPPRMLVDWIFGSDEVTFSSYRVDLSPHVRRTTDHPLVVAEATVPGYRERIRRG